MAGVLQSTLLADEDQSLSLGEPHVEVHQSAKAGGIGLCQHGGLVGEAAACLTGLLVGSMLLQVSCRVGLLQEAACSCRPGAEYG